MLIVGALVELAANGVDPVDGGVAVWRDGQFIFCMAEERAARRKYAGGFRHALLRGLDQFGLELSDVDVFSFVTYGEPVPDDLDYLRRQIPGDGNWNVHLCRSHHRAHALQVARLAESPPDLIAVFDNEGMVLGRQRVARVFANSMERSTYFLATATAVEVLTRDQFGRDAVSLGEAYRRFSYYCGFPSHQLAGKTMALAALGEPSAFGELELISGGAEGLQVDLQGRPDEPAASVIDFFARHGLSVAPARHPGAPMDRDHINAAAFVQAELERAVIARLRHLIACTGATSIGLGGGVAYNCRLVAALESALDLPVTVPPSPGDQGLGVGAVLDYLEVKLGITSQHPAEARLGGRYVPEAPDHPGLASRWVSSEQLVTAIVEALVNGGIVGLIDGRSECGRRALGARSLLCLPESEPMERLRVAKNRESFRPFGASLLASAVGAVYSDRGPDRFMLRAPLVRSDGPATIVAHTDGTLRAQLVADADDSILASVLHHLVALGRPGLVVNTSMNLAGEPMVETPEEGMRLLQECSAIDILAIADGPLLVRRSES
jgi:carbamoyltransferase